MPGYCSVVGCKSNGCMLGRKFYRFPILNTLNARTLAITKARQAAWVVALDLADFYPNYYKSAIVCDLHFISGRPAHFTDVDSPDWIPSRNLKDDCAKQSDVKPIAEINLEPMDILESNEEIMPSCCVTGCRATMRHGPTKTFRLPMVDNRNAIYKELSEQRQKAWLVAIHKTDADMNSYKHIAVCENHFISGQSAALTDIDNPDWVPTLNLEKNVQRKLHSRTPAQPTCSVFGCNSSKQNGRRKYFHLPMIDERINFKVLSAKRQAAWLSALGISNRHPATYKNIRVCDSHFICGMPAKLQLTTDPDWVPTLNMGNKEMASSFSMDPLDLGSNEINELYTTSLGGHDVNKPTPTPALEPIKSGEILRGENGQFSFSCLQCLSLSYEMQEMLDHINSHFSTNDTIIHIDIERAASPSPEFVDCTTFSGVKIKPETTYTPDETLTELTNTILKPKSSSLSGVLKTNSGKPNHPLVWRPDDQCNKMITTDKPKTSNVAKPVVMETKIETSLSQGGTIHDQLEKKINLNGSKISNAPVRIIKLHPVRLKDRLICDGAKKPRLTPSKDLVKKTTLPPNEAIMKCYQCQKDPPVTNELEPKRHVCIFCKDKGFSNHLEYKTHLEEVHKIEGGCYQCESKPPITNKSDPRRHKCLFCQEWFPNHIEFRTHFRNVHNQDADYFFSTLSNCHEFTCYKCEKNFPLRCTLVNHMITNHSSKYLCPNCDLRLNTYAELTQHLKTHKCIPLPIECGKCGKTFKSSQRLEIHKKCHTTEMNFICEICAKRFKLIKYLNSHMALHKDTKLPCRHCDATFNFSSCRRMHEKSQHNVV